MYEQFGAQEIDGQGSVRFRLFYPDGDMAPYQYEGGGLPRVTEVRVVGDVQPRAERWNADCGIRMQRSEYTPPDGHAPVGWLYECVVPNLEEGFYEYKYQVRFEGGPPRVIADPCARYGGSRDQNAGVVIGGRRMREVTPLAKRLPLSDLVIYELMIDDFTAGYRDGKAPLRAVTEKLDYLQGLGINAIEFMPWTEWPTDGFSWGYNPFQYFAVAHQYTLDPENPADKIFYLKELISECHKRGIHVLMDGVFNHAEADPPDRGFGYYWLYQDPADSPYVGNYADHAYFRDLDYANRCVLEYIRDACFYWIDQFKIDGIRFDNTLGFYKPDDRGHGLPKLLSEIRGHLSRAASDHFVMTLEHSWDYNAVDVVNNVGATSCWLDPYRQLSTGFLGSRDEAECPRIDARIMRMLDAARDFDEGRVPTIYVENHDHESFVLKAGGRAHWALAQPYLIALFTSPGAVLIHNGQEFGEDYWMPETGEGRVEPRPLHWTYVDDEPGTALGKLHRRLIAMRAAHPALRSSHFHPACWPENRATLDSAGFGVDVARNVVIFHRWGTREDGSTELCYIGLNFSQETQRLEIPVAANTDWEDLLTGQTHQAENWHVSIDVGSNWGVVLCAKV